MSDSTSSSSGSSSGSSTSNSDPRNMDSRQSDYLLQLAEQANALAQQQEQWAQGEFQKNSALTDTTVNNFLSGASSAFAQGQKDMAQYNNLFAPENAQLVQDANSYASDNRIKAEMGSAEADTGAAMDAGRENAIKDLQAFGVDPSSGRYAALDKAERAQRAAAQAGAGNQARKQTEATGRALRSQAIQVGETIPGQAVNELNASFAGNSAAQNAKLANTTVGANIMGTGKDFMNTAMGLKLPPVANTSQGRSSQQSTQQGGSQSHPDSNSNKGNKGGGQQHPGDGGGGGGGHSAGGGYPMGGGAQPAFKSFPSSPGSSGPGSPNAPGGGSSVMGGSNAFSNPGSSNAPGGGSSVMGGSNAFSNPGSPNAPGGGSSVMGGSNAFSNPGGPSSVGGGSSVLPSAGGGSSAGGGGSSTQGGNGGGYSSGGYSGGGGSSYAEGGPVGMPAGQRGLQMTRGGQVPRSASPSQGMQTDDVNAKLNAGEFVIPKDVAAWKGHQHFQKLIDQSRAEMSGATAKPKMKPATPGPASFTSQPQGMQGMQNAR